MKRGRNKIVKALTACAGAWLTIAASTAGAEQRAHQHGVGQLNIAIEGKQLEMELVLPGSDAVGFEHRPSSEDDRRAIRVAEATLRDGRQIFAFPAGARCRFEKTELQSALLEERHDDGHHAHDRHSESHKEHAHKEHGHKEPAREENHAEFRVHYHLDCANPSKLTHLDAVFFKSFPSAQKLVTRWITARQQGAVTLTPASIRLTF